MSIISIIQTNCPDIAVITESQRQFEKKMQYSQKSTPYKISDCYLQGGERKRVTKQPSIPEDTSSESDETEDQENRGRIQEKENRRFVQSIL